MRCKGSGVKDVKGEVDERVFMERMRVVVQ